MTSEQIIGALVAIFAFAGAIIAGMYRHRGRQLQAAHVEADQAERKVEHLEAEREIKEKNDEEVADDLTRVLGASAPDPGKRR